MVYSHKMYTTQGIFIIYIFSTNRTTAKLGDKTMVIEDFKSGT